MKKIVFCSIVSIAVIVTGTSFGKEKKSAEIPPDIDISIDRSVRGPVDTDFRSKQFKIVKVLRTEKRLTALGLSTLIEEAKGIGKFDEGRKELLKSEQGENYLVKWKYKGKKILSNVALEFDYRLKNVAKTSTLRKEYPNLKRGTYKIVFEHIGSNFERNGKILYWRVRIFVGDELVLKKSSFLWDIFEVEKTKKVEKTK